MFPCPDRVDIKFHYNLNLQTTYRTVLPAKLVLLPSAPSADSLQASRHPVMDKNDLSATARQLKSSNQLMLSDSARESSSLRFFDIQKQNSAHVNQRVVDLPGKLFDEEVSIWTPERSQIELKQKAAKPPNQELGNTFFKSKEQGMLNKSRG